MRTCGARASVQVMIDTGMTRSGVCDHKLADLLVRIGARPSLQLVGSESGRTLDLNSLTAAGVKLVGRLAAARADDGIDADVPNGVAHRDALSRHGASRR